RSAPNCRPNNRSPGTCPAPQSFLKATAHIHNAFGNPSAPDARRPPAHKKPDSDTARRDGSRSGLGSPPDPHAPDAPAHPSQSTDHGLADITPTRCTPRPPASHVPNPP